MIQLIIGQNGEGKTKQMIQSANQKCTSLKGQVVYIDSTSKHRYALSHAVRLIESSNFPISTPTDFFGFLCGILSANHDIEMVYIDELIKITRCEINELSSFFDKLEALSQKYQVDFMVSVNCSSKDLPTTLQSYLIAS